MGASEDPDFVAGAPPHTAQHGREPKWLGWYGAALCIPACAVVAFGFAAYSSGVNGDGDLVGAIMLALVGGFFGGIFLIHGRSKRAWLASVVGGLFVGSVICTTIGALGSRSIGKTMCEHGFERDCSLLGRTVADKTERAYYNEKACEGGVRGGCGRLARDEGAPRARAAFDRFCAGHATDYRCSNRDVESFCSSSTNSMSYEYGSPCLGDY